MKKWKPKNVKLTSINRLSVNMKHEIFGYHSVQSEYQAQMEHTRKNGLWFPEPMGVLALENGDDDA